MKSMNLSEHIKKITHMENIIKHHTYKYTISLIKT